MKTQLGAYSALSTVVDVTGENHERCVSSNCKIDQIVKRIQGCIPKGAGDPWGKLTDSFERRVQVKVSSVNEPEVQNSALL